MFLTVFIVIGVHLVVYLSYKNSPELYYFSVLIAVSLDFSVFIVLVEQLFIYLGGLK